MIDATVTSPQSDLNAYPNFIVIRFNPSNLPSGMVNFHDLAQVVQGLQEIIEEVPLRELGTEDRFSERTDSVPLIAFTPAEGSYELTVTLKSILDYVFKTLHMDVPQRLDPKTFLELSAQASIISNSEVLAAGAAREQYRSERARLQHAVILLNDVRESDLKPVSGYITSKLKTAFRRMRDVGTDAATLFYDPPTIRTDQKDAVPVPLDQRFNEGVKRTIEKDVQGPIVRAYGNIIAWHSEVPYFNLSVAHFGRNVRCNYRMQLDREVRVLSVGKSIVAVEGRAYYEGEANQESPPAYIVVQRIHAVQREPKQTYVELTPKSKRERAERVPAGRPAQISLWSTSQPE